MTANTMQVEVVSLEEEIFSGKVLHLQATGSMGDLGVYPNHAPLLTKLTPGPVQLHQPDGSLEIVFVSGGMLEVQPGVVTILADTVLRGQDMDEAQALEAQKQAEKTLSEQKGDVDYAKARADLVRAAALLKTIREIRKQIK